MVIEDLYKIREDWNWLMKYKKDDIIRYDSLKFENLISIKNQTKNVYPIKHFTWPINVQFPRNTT